jgi:nucleotide-binding universal stress UspA family protein
MFQIRKILVPTDYSNCAEAALMHALHLAEALGAEVHVLHVREGGIAYDHDRIMPDVSADFAGTYARCEPRERIGEGSYEYWNEVFVRRVDREKVEATPVILEYAQEQDVDLIVMGTHGHRSVDRFLNDVEDHWPIGKTAEQVIKLADRPVFTVGPRSSRMPDLVERVLAPVDFSGHARRALTYAKHLAKLYGVPLYALHVIEESEAGGAAPSDAAVLAELRRFYDSAEGPDVEMLSSVRRGTPSREILKEAGRDRMDIIVLSSHGRKGLDELRLGKEAEQIIRAAPCPVFTDKAFGKSLRRKKSSGKVDRGNPKPATVAPKLGSATS